MLYLPDKSHEFDHAEWRAMRAQKHKIIDGFSRVVTLVIIMGLVGVFFSAMKQAEFEPAQQIKIETPLEMR